MAGRQEQAARSPSIQAAATRDKKLKCQLHHTDPTTASLLAIPQSSGKNFLV